VGHGRYWDLLGLAKENGKGLRVRLRIQPPEQAALPARPTEPLRLTDDDTRQIGQRRRRNLRALRAVCGSD
jgi:hypothetical protein